jgi:hypothetical protein
MSKFSDLKKSSFINKAHEYSEGKKKNISERVTFTMEREYIDILNMIAKKDRLSKSQIVRASVLYFSRLTKEDKEGVYEEIY